MRTFVINLEKNPDRMERIDAQLRACGVPYERRVAVYGKNVPEAERKKVSNRFAWKCICGIPMRDGELGCALSHLGVYQKMVREGIGVACILEDDANPNAHLAEHLRRIEESVDCSKPKAWLLSASNAGGRTDWAEWEIRTGLYTEGYVITLSAARAILEDNLPIKVPADAWGRWVKKDLLKLYQVSPAACDQAWQQAGYSSDVTPDNAALINVKTMSSFDKCVWNVRRAIGLTIAHLFYF